jgi:hypothetical protein
MKAKRVAKDFPVVCVAGSAGGLDAYTRLLRPHALFAAVLPARHFGS